VVDVSVERRAAGVQQERERILVLSFFATFVFSVATLDVANSAFGPLTGNARARRL